MVDINRSGGATTQDQAEQAAGRALKLKEEYQMKATELAAEKAEFNEGVAAMEESADQLNNGQANLAGDQIEMINPPTFLKCLFGSRSTETKTTSLLCKLDPVLTKLKPEPR